MNLRAFVRGAFLAVGTALLATPAQAHLVNTGLGPFYDGVSHFALTAEDLVPALAIALLAGQNGSRAGRWALFALPAAWLVGGILGLAFPTVESATVVTTISFLALGGLVAAQARLSPRSIAILTIAVGLLHGYLNGGAMAQAKLGGLGVIGIVATLFVLVALAAGGVVAIRARWGRIAVRVAGSWIVAVGLLLAGWSLRGG